MQIVYATTRIVLRPDRTQVEYTLEPWYSQPRTERFEPHVSSLIAEYEVIHRAIGEAIAQLLAANRPLKEASIELRLLNLDAYARLTGHPGSALPDSAHLARLAWYCLPHFARVNITFSPKERA